MKGYERFTEKGKPKYCEKLKSGIANWEAILRLSNLEDKIERGEIDYVADKDKEIARLTAENAELRARLSKAVELPAIVMIERTLVNGKFKPTQKAKAFNGRIGVVYRDETKWKGLLVDICSEKTSDYEPAKARLAELKGGNV